MNMREKITQLEDLQKLVNLNDLQEILLGNYHRVIGEYEISGGDIFCQCVEGRNSICNQKHKHGYIIQLKTNNLSIIGNQCVKKMGNDTQIRKDINTYNNAKRRFSKLENLKQYFEDKDTYLQKLEYFQKEISEFKTKKEYFSKFMGQELDRLTTSSRTIQITGIKESRNEKQNSSQSKKNNITKIPYTIGSIKGLDSVLSYQNYRNTEEKIVNFEKGMNNLINLVAKMDNESYDPTEKEINAYRIQLENIKEIEIMINKIKYDWADFEANKPKQMVFAYGKPYKFIQYLLNINKDEAKNFCSITEQEFKDNNNLDSISRTAMRLIPNNHF